MYIGLTSDDPIANVEGIEISHNTKMYYIGCNTIPICYLPSKERHATY